MKPEEEENLEHKKELGQVEGDHGGEHHQPAPQEHETPLKIRLS